MFRTISEIQLHLENIFNNKKIKEFKYIIPTFSHIIDINKESIFDKSIINDLNIGWTRAIGHEIHYCRNILIYLKYNNLLNKDIIILTTKEKSFFYENLFKTEIITENNINLFFDNTLHLYLVTAVNYSSFIDIYRNVYINKKYYDDIKNFNLNVITNQNKYVLIHQRYTNDINIIINIINKILNKYHHIHIYIFSESLNNPIQNDKIICFNNIKEYFSLLNSKNCNLLITPISGLGEMANYIGNCNVLILNDNPFTSNIYYDKIKNFHNKNKFDSFDYDNYFYLMPLDQNFRYILDITKPENLKNIDNEIDLILEKNIF